MCYEIVHFFKIVTCNKEMNLLSNFLKEKINNKNQHSDYYRL